MHQLPAGQRAAIQEQTVTTTRSPSGARRLAPFLLSAVTFGADQLTKLLVVERFVPGESLPIIPSLLHLTYVQNRGAAFGLLQGQQLLFVGLAILVIGWLGRELMKPATARLVAWAAALVLGGAAGNLLDRIRLGYVVDFIDVRVWPVFNVGDSAITIGVCLLLWDAFVGGRSRNRRRTVMNDR